MIPKVGQVWKYKGTSQNWGYRPIKIEIVSVASKTRTVRIKDISHDDDGYGVFVYRSRYTYAELVSVYELDPVYKALEDFDKELSLLLEEQEELLDVQS